MKIILSSVFVLLLVQGTNAKTLLNQLIEFNYNWAKYETRLPKLNAITFLSETEYIQEHLKNVLVILNSNPTKQLSPQQLTSRNYLLKELRKYRTEGKFPINYYRTVRIPVFIDEHNTHCAVGFLMQQSGYESLALATSQLNNYIWVKDIKDPKVIAWQEKSGFTLEELKLIQGAYDSYDRFAFTAPNKYEIPQKPEVKIAYFDEGKIFKIQSGGRNSVQTDKSKLEVKSIWFYGEGKNGVLNGKWIQNFAAGVPWIEGYFNNGKRSGQWKEYYQGTDILCRTENWQNDKLNGIRRRFDRETGKIVEEILFKNGNAVKKVNYDFDRGLRYERKPLDSVNVYTEVYTLEGALLASGNEKVHNPGNLLWFQNIELTALNSAAITARDLPNQNGPQSLQRGRNLYGSPQLVEYKKEGDWIYYRNSNQDLPEISETSTLSERMISDFRLLGPDLNWSIRYMNEVKVNNGYDSIIARYENNNIRDFYGFGLKEFNHIHMSYYPASNKRVFDEIDIYRGQIYQSQSFHHQNNLPILPVLKEIGQYNSKGLRIGDWKYFNQHQEMTSFKKYIIPFKEEEDEVKK